MAVDILATDGAPVDLPPMSSGYPAVTYTTVSGADEVVVAYREGGNIELTGYALDGTQVFSGAGAGSGPGIGLEAFSLAPAGGAGSVMTYTLTGSGGAGVSYWSTYDLISPAGQTIAENTIQNAYGMTAFGASDGAHLEWNKTAGPPNSNGQPTDYTFSADNVSSSGVASAVSTGSTGSSPVGILPYADIAIPNRDDLIITDNRAEMLGKPSVVLPGEPANAITDLAGAGLINSDTAAVAWVDSGTDYVAIYNAATNSFGARIGLDWGGASDMHVVALPDGGFAVSWMNGGAYKGEVFDASGNGGGVIPLAGDMAGIASNGDLYTVGLNSSGQYVVQDYAINSSGGSSSGGGSTGSGGGSDGHTFTSDNNGDHWTGTTGNDTFHLGRGGDMVTGNGGNDTFDFAEIPWAGGQITDFNAGDVLDLTGLMHTTQDTGSDGFADGYLKITDSSGGADVWAQYATSGSNSGWWLVETLDGVSASTLTTSGDVVTVTSNSVSTSASNYVAPSYVSSITLTGSQQTVTANNAQDTTIWSDNTGNTIHGGTGDETIHIGRGGDTVYGGAGKDVFVFDDIPWAPATIEDLYPDQGDSIDVSGILARAGYTGSDPIADGYLQITGNKIYADYHLPGNDGWWQVATVYSPAPALQYVGNGIIDAISEHVGGTVTTPGSGVSTAGYDTIIMTGSNGNIVANDGGDTLIDEGSNNQMYGRQGNDTFVLGTSTTLADDGWGGVNTWVMNPDSTVLTHNTTGLWSGDRLDVRDLLAASHYIGSDPVGDGYVYMAYPPPPAFGEMGDFVRSQLMYDPDGAAGPQAARPLFDMYDTSPNQFHYVNGFFVVQ